jgi:hypothetical protein
VAAAIRSRGTIRSTQCHSDAGWPASGAYRCAEAAGSLHGSVQSSGTSFGADAGTAASSAATDAAATDAELGRAVGDLDPEHEAHAVEEDGQRRGIRPLDDEPGGLAVVDDVRHVLDVTGRVEEEGLGGGAGLERSSAWLAMECSQLRPVWPRDGEDAAVGQVDDRLAALEAALLDDRVAVVSRHALVDALGGHRAVERQEGRGRHQSTFASRA